MELKPQLESGSVTADLTTTVILGYELLINDMKVTVMYTFD